MASWGSLISEGADQINPIRIYWWLLVFPALFALKRWQEDRIRPFAFFVVVIILLLRRYDSLLERTETRLKEASLDRIADAKAHAALANQYLVTAAQLMQHMSAMVTSTQQTMSTIESVGRTLDVIHDRMTRPGERR